MRSLDGPSRWESGLFRLSWHFASRGLKSSGAVGSTFQWPFSCLCTELTSGALRNRKHPLNDVFILAPGIGIVAGLRSFTAPAVVAWSAHLSWLDLHGS